MPSPKKPRRMARPPAGMQDACNAVATAVQPTKQALVMAMLEIDGGASLAAISEATGWQPHTVRAALTGLRKKGHSIIRRSVDGKTCYAIAPAAAQ